MKQPSASGFEPPVREADYNRCARSARRGRSPSSYPLSPTKKNSNFGCCFFIQAAEGGLVWHRRASAACNHGVSRVWHRACACMFVRRLDYIQCFALITYRSSSGFHTRLRRNSIHAFGVIWYGTTNSVVVSTLPPYKTPLLFGRQMRRFVMISIPAGTGDILLTKTSTSFIIVKGQ